MRDDEEFEEALVDAINGVAHSLKYLGNGDAWTSMGGMEAHGKIVSEALQEISSAISEHSQAIESLADAIRAHGKRQP